MQVKATESNIGESEETPYKSLETLADYDPKAEAAFAMKVMEAVEARNAQNPRTATRPK